MLLNTPAVAILVYVGWVTVGTFFRAQYLSGDYFLHAFWVTAIALLLSFFALQVLIRLAASPRRLVVRAFKRLPSLPENVEGRPAGQGQVDTPWLLDALRRAGAEFNVILEVWPPEQPALEQTIALEDRWVRESIPYLRQFISA